MTTTDPLAGSPLALAPTPDGMVGFGLAEMVYLASRGSTDAAQISRDFLGMKEMEDDATAFLAASSLTARGMLTSGGDDELEVLSSAALVQIVLSTATRWTRLGLLSESSNPAIIYVLQAPELLAIIEPSAMATWWTAFSDETDTAAEVVTTLVEQRTAERPGTACIIDSRGPQAGRNNLLVTRNDDGSITVVAGVEPGGTGGEPQELPEGGLTKLVAEVLTA